MIQFFRFIIVVLFTVFLTSCDTSTHKENPITIAISPWAGYSFALLANDLGYLRVNGSDQIKLIIYPSLSDSRLAYTNGNVDGMFSTMIEVIESTQQGNKTPNIILVTNFSNGPDKILAKEETKTLEDLRGKRIGVEPSSIGMYMLNRALEINNIPFNDFFLVHMGSEVMEKALSDNIIDAAISYPPFTHKIKNLAPNNIFDSGKIPDEIIDLLVIEEQVINRNSKQVQLLINGWIRAYDFYKNNPGKANAIIQQHPEFSQINLLQDLESITLTNYNNQAELFSLDGKLEKSLINITRQMNNHNLISRQIDSKTIINKKILELYPGIN